MLKRILLSLALLAAAGTVAVGATRALLANSATLTANSFSTGTPDLQIGRDDTEWLDTVTGFTDTLVPGQSKNYYMWLKNSSNNGITMAIAGQATNVSVTGGVITDDVSISFTPVNGAGDPTGSVFGPANLTGWAGGYGFTSPTYDLAAGVSQRYRMTVSMSSGVTTAGSANFDMVFTGTQTP